MTDSIQLEVFLTGDLTLEQEKRLIDIATRCHAVAAAIEAAIDDSNPRLHYVVGADGELLLVGPRRISDEEWVGDGRAMSDEKYFDLMRRRYGLDLA